MTAATEGEELLYISTITKEEEGARGRRPPPGRHAGASLLQRRRPLGLPRRGAVATISITTGLHLFFINNFIKPLNFVMFPRCE